MTVPIAALQWYRLQCYAWYRFSAIVNITYKIEGKYIIFNSNALYLGGAPWVIKSYTQKHITLIQNEASPDKEKVAIIELDRID